MSLSFHRYGLLLAAIFGVALHGNCSGSSLPLRGVDPTLREKYTGSTFTCLDGSVTFSISKVNDNYCDCVDGSDEPGTSACANGSYYCRNRGYTALKIPSFYVNDGVCDCCDGSDEYEGIKSCENKCIELGKSIRETVMLQAQAAEQGVRAKQAHLLKAAETLKRWEAEIQTTTISINELKPAVDVLNAKYQSAKEAAAKRKEAEKAAEEALRAEEEANKPVEEAEPLGEESQAPAEDGESAQESQPHDLEPATSPEEEVEETEEERGKRIAQQWTTNAESAGTEEVESEEERGKRIAAQWTTNEESAGLDAKSVDEEEVGQEAYPDTVYDDDGNVLYQKPPDWNDEEDGVWEPPEDISDEDFDDYDDHHHYSDYPEHDDDLDTDPGEDEHGDFDDAPYDEDSYSYESFDSEDKPMGWWYRWGLKALVRRLRGIMFGSTQFDGDSLEVEEIKSEYDAQRNKLASLELNKEKLEKNLQNDYGPAKEFLHLVDECLEVKVNQYTYKLCAFDKAEQVERGSGTSLGKWEGFKDNYTKMSFTGGATCWNGPARSLEVNLLCGSKDVLSKVEEPSRCEYVAELHTPAACSLNTLDALKEQIEQMRKDVEAAQEGHEEL